MKTIRNLIIFAFLFFLVINFMLDFSVITNQFGKNGQQFISKYLIAHKNTNNLEKEIEELKKERNKFERLKIMIEEVYTDLKIIYTPKRTVGRTKLPTIRIMGTAFSPKSYLVTSVLGLNTVRNA